MNCRSSVDGIYTSEHHLHTNHRIDWDSAKCVTYSTDYYKRLTLESWFTNLEQTPLNRCQQLPAAYNFKVAKETANVTKKHVSFVKNVLRTTKTRTLSVNDFNIFFGAKINSIYFGAVSARIFFVFKQKGNVNWNVK